MPDKSVDQTGFALSQDTASFESGCFLSRCDDAGLVVVRKSAGHAEASAAGQEVLRGVRKPTAVERRSGSSSPEDVVGFRAERSERATILSAVACGRAPARGEQSRKAPAAVRRGAAIREVLRGAGRVGGHPGPCALAGAGGDFCGAGSSERCGQDQRLSLIHI
eukprot:5223357-Pyramimonas_sp.AAC.1